MFWADEIVKKAIKIHGKKSQLISTGITPSGHIHFGHAMEVFIADTIRAAFRTHNIKADLIYIRDDFDHLRKIPKGVPKSFKKYLGMPLIFVPDPKGNKKLSFAERYLGDFFYALNQLELKVKKVSQYELYKSGKMTEVIDQAIKNQKKIKKILETISNRELNKNWSPVSPLCAKCKKLGFNNILEYDLKKHRVLYKCECGNKAWANYSKGEAKLGWRVDWPAKWEALGVTVEPFGKDHAASGGSYESGVAICEKIYKRKPPVPIPYENIYLKGQKGKMSSSVGNVISLKDAVDNFPPEALKYLVMRKKPNRHLIFDPGEGLLQVIDEITKLQDKKVRNKFDKNQIRAYELSQIRQSRVNISFRHLVNVVQAAQGNFQEIKRLLKRTNHFKKVSDEKILKREIKRVKNWLDNFAPEKVKFQIQKSLPPKAQDLSAKQKQLLNIIIKKLQENRKIIAESLHNFIYESGKKLDLTPAETFQPIYWVILGKDSGPKIGWFLIMLNKKFLIKRFKEAIKNK